MRYPIAIDWSARSLTIFFDDAVYFVLEIAIGRNIVKGSLPMALTIKDSQKFSVLATRAVSAKGNIATLDGPLVWEVSDPLKLAQSSSPEGVISFSAVGPLGTAQVRVTGDADMGEGIRAIAGVLDVEIIAGDAVSIVIEPGVPEEQ